MRGSEFAKYSQNEYSAYASDMSMLVNVLSFDINDLFSFSIPQVV